MLGWVVFVCVLVFLLRLSSGATDMMAEQECKDAAQLYEFDAPTEVMDLNEMKGSEIDDNWFGE